MGSRCKRLQDIGSGCGTRTEGQCVAGVLECGDCSLEVVTELELASNFLKVAV